MANRRARGARVSSALSEINVVPLVDVMLVLLIIFMVTAPMMQQGLAVNLPQARKSDPVKAQPIYVTIPATFVAHQAASVRQGRDRHRGARRARAPGAPHARRQVDFPPHGCDDHGAGHLHGDRPLEGCRRRKGWVLHPTTETIDARSSQRHPRRARASRRRPQPDGGPVASRARRVAQHVDLHAGFVERRAPTQRECDDDLPRGR